MCCKSTVIFGVKDDHAQTDEEESETEEDIEERGIRLLYNVVPWKSIVRDYWESKGVEVSEQSEDTFTFAKYQIINVYNFIGHILSNLCDRQIKQKDKKCMIKV